MVCPIVWNIWYTWVMGSKNIMEEKSIQRILECKDKSSHCMTKPHTLTAAWKSNPKHRKSWSILHTSIVRLLRLRAMQSMCLSLVKPNGLAKRETVFQRGPPAPNVPRLCAVQHAFSRRVQRRPNRRASPPPHLRRTTPFFPSRGVQKQIGPGYSWGRNLQSKLLCRRWRRGSSTPVSWAAAQSPGTTPQFWVN